MAVHTVTGSMARYGVVGSWTAYDVGLDLLEAEILNFTLTGIGLFSGSGFKTATVTGDISATASLSGVGNIEAIIVGSIVGEGSLETDATGAHTGVAGLDSLGDPQSEGTSTRSGEVDITGIGIFTPDGSKAFTDDGQIEGIGITVADVFKTGVANAIIVGEGIAQGDGSSARTVNAALGSVGDPAATGGINATDDGTIVGVGVLASNVIKNALQSGTIVGVGSLAGDGSAGGYTANAVHFDGTNDYLTRGADLTGNADGKVGLLSVWVNLTGGDGVFKTVWASRIAGGAGPRVTLQRTDGNKWQMLGANAAGTVILNMTSTTSYTSASGWHNVRASWDLLNGDGWLYVGDTDDLAAGATLTNDTLDYTIAQHVVGAVYAGSFLQLLDGDLADLYVNYAEVQDQSVEANRRKFFSATGKPVSLGADGSTPTGTAPIVFLSNATATWQTNLGGGGGFTEVGALTDAASSPSD
jgi:hypothetical protein